MKNLQHFFDIKHLRRWIIVIFILASVMFWLGIIIYDKYYVSTDNAYVNANTVQMTTRISGQINKLYVTNNQYVTKGQLLFEIDPLPFQLALSKAEAQVAINQAALTNAKTSAQRKLELVNKKVLSAQEGDNTTAVYEAALANLKSAQAQLDQARLDLGWTKVASPSNGWVTNLSLRVGDNISAYQPLFVLINDQEFWIDANFKETNLAKVKPGLKATIVVDMYPHHTFHGLVQSISAGTGSAFSLLPPQNATGNWVKITQRIPVRVLILDPDSNFPLRVGSSATVNVELK